MAGGIVIHKCPKKDSSAYADMCGWGLVEIPLQTDISRRTGLPRHVTCPYCGAETAKMEGAPADEAMKLNVNLRAKGSVNSPYATVKAQNAELSSALADIRKQLADLKKGGSK